ncbi:MAG: glycosyltransferase family 39 protein [Chloroflexota bacterium]
MTSTVWNARTRGVGTAALLIAVGLYLALALPHLSRPGLYYDEALQAPAAIRLLGQDPHRGLDLPRGISLLGRELPVMTMSYLGAPKSYLIAAAFVIGGVSVESLRLLGVAVGVITVALTACLAWRLSGWLAGAIGGMLLASDPAFVLHTRTDWGPVALAAVLRVGAMLALAAWLDSGRSRWLVLGAWLLGLAVYDKASALWLVLALGLVGILAWLAFRWRPGPRPLALAAGAFVLGSAPFWLWNAFNDWAAFRFAARGNLGGGIASTDLASLLAAASDRPRLLGEMLSGGGMDVLQFGTTIDRPLWLSAQVPLLVLAMGLSLWSSFRDGAWAACFRRLWLGPLLALIVFAQMLASPLAIWQHHLIGLYPLPQLFIGAAAGELARDRRTDRWTPPRAALSLGLVWALVANILLMGEYHGLMTSWGGAGNWSPVIGDVASVLQEELRGRTVQTLDWGAAYPLMVYSGGAVRIEELWVRLREGDRAALARRELRDPANVFLLREPGRENFPGPAATFWQAAQADGRRPCLERVFTDTDGRPLYRLYAFGGCPQAARQDEEWR